ncbi:MAG: HEAT repeat domain-containing protein [Firmicutes bacterium]|nr:HEAT repeat domain-containing protein [Bacillota bacterium]
MTFGHDIPCPDDRAIAYYLYQDYFHDSEVKDIHPQGADMVLTLESNEDHGLFYDKCKGTHEERRAQCQAQAERFTFQIIFRKCSYWHDERRAFPPNFSYGRFLRSALLAQIEAELGKPHYHFRIEMWGGYVEAVCQNIRIRKLAGRIHPRPLEYGDWARLELWRDGALLDGDGRLREDAVYSLAAQEFEEGKYECRDFESGVALLWLMRNCSPRALPLAREALSHKKEGDWEILFFAARVLGELGNGEDIPLLLREYAVCNELFVNDLLRRRNILDAIEKIQARQALTKGA